MIVVVVVVFRESPCRAWRRSAPRLAARVLRGPADCALQNPRTSKEMSIAIKNSTACSDSAPTTLLSTKSICSIARRRHKRHSTRSTTSFDLARFAISARRIFMPGKATPMGDGRSQERRRLCHRAGCRSRRRMPNVSWFFVLALRRRRLRARSASSPAPLLPGLSGGLQDESGDLVGMGNQREMA